MKDSRYNTVGKLIRANGLSMFDEILDTIPKTRLAKDLNIKPEKMNRLIEDKELFTMKLIIALAELLEVDPEVVFSFTLKQHLQDKKSRKKK